MNKKSIIAVSIVVIIIISPFLFLYIYKYKIENDLSIKINFVDLRKANLTDTLSYNILRIERDNDYYIMEFLSNTDLDKIIGATHNIYCSKVKNYYKYSEIDKDTNIVFNFFISRFNFLKKVDDKFLYGVKISPYGKINYYNNDLHCFQCRIFFTKMFEPRRGTDYFTIPKDSLKVLLKK